MEFQIFHNHFFNAKKGSYSVVTHRENYDSQITLTDFETEMVLQHFGEENIQIGSVGTNPGKAQKTFYLYPDNIPVNLNVIFPKPEKRELRLYISSRAGFKPIGGEVWFMFIGKSENLYIGSMPFHLWNDLDQYDLDDPEYLQEVEIAIPEVEKILTPPTPKIVKGIKASREIFVRDPRMAAFSLQHYGYQCEVNDSHNTFIAEKSQKPYVEAHHLIPFKFQSEFSFPLDCVENILCLCPNCHRGIHLGKVEHKRELIKTLYDKRPVVNGFDLTQVLSFYNSLEIKQN